MNAHPFLPPPHLRGPLQVSGGNKPPGVDQQVPWKGEASGPLRGCLLEPLRGQRKKPDKLKHEPLQLPCRDLALDEHAYPSPRESDCGTHHHCPSHPSPSEGSLCSAQGEARAQGPFQLPSTLICLFTATSCARCQNKLSRSPPRTPRQPRRPRQREAHVRGHACPACEAEEGLPEVLLGSRETSL